jgi:hypothetical protein
MALKGGVIGWFRVVLGACTWLVLAATIHWFTESHGELASHQIRQQLEEQQIQRPITRQNTTSNNLGSSTMKERGLTAEEELQQLSANQILELRATAAHGQYGRPALSTILVENETVIGDPSWLLNFGVIGYGKCGTSSMMVWLKEHPEVQAFGYELKELMGHRPGLLIRRLYTELLPGPFQRGYKAPQGTWHRGLYNCRSD